MLAAASARRRQPSAAAGAGSGVRARSTVEWRAGRLLSLKAGVYAVGQPSNLTRDGHLDGGRPGMRAGSGARAIEAPLPLWQLRPNASSTVDVTVRGAAAGQAAGTSPSHQRTAACIRDDTHRPRRHPRHHRRPHHPRRSPRSSIAAQLRAIARAGRAHAPLRPQRDRSHHRQQPRSTRNQAPLRPPQRRQLTLPPSHDQWLERAFLDFCADHELPRPQINTSVGGYEVDACLARPPARRRARQSHLPRDDEPPSSATAIRTRRSSSPAIASSGSHTAS